MTSEIVYENFTLGVLELTGSDLFESYTSPITFKFWLAERLVLQLSFIAELNDKIFKNKTINTNKFECYI